MHTVALLYGDKLFSDPCDPILLVHTIGGGYG